MNIKKQRDILYACATGLQYHQETMRQVEKLVCEPEQEYFIEETFKTLRIENEQLREKLRKLSYVIPSKELRQEYESSIKNFQILYDENKKLQEELGKLLYGISSEEGKLRRELKQLQKENKSLLEKLDIARRFSGFNELKQLKEENKLFGAEYSDLLTSYQKLQREDYRLKVRLSNCGHWAERFMFRTGRQDTELRNIKREGAETEEK